MSKTMTKADLVARIRESETDLDIPTKDVAQLVDAAIHHMTEAICNGETIRFKGFGTFEVQTRAARTGRNPATGESIQVPEKRTAKWRPSAQLKKALNR